jgi:hypothetical protein
MPPRRSSKSDSDYFRSKKNKNKNKNKKLDRQERRTAITARASSVVESP